MLHLFFKWRYNRKSRAGAFKLPKIDHSISQENTHLGSYLSQHTIRGRGFKHYDLPRKRRKWIQSITALALIVFILWVAYESLVALALMGK